MTSEEEEEIALTSKLVAQLAREVSTVFMQHGIGLGTGIRILALVVSGVVTGSAHMGARDPTKNLSVEEASALFEACYGGVMSGVVSAIDKSIPSLLAGENKPQSAPHIRLVKKEN